MYSYDDFDDLPGWKPLYKPLLALCKRLDIRVTQIKEKFGGLRFYTDVVPDDISGAVYGAICDAERRSLQTCEQCGRENGRWDRAARAVIEDVTTAPLEGRFWTLTLCAACRSARLAERP